MCRIRHHRSCTLRKCRQRRWYCIHQCNCKHLGGRSRCVLLPQSTFSRSAWFDQRSWISSNCSTVHSMNHSTRWRSTFTRAETARLHTSIGLRSQDLKKKQRHDQESRLVVGLAKACYQTRLFDLCLSTYDLTLQTPPPSLLIRPDFYLPSAKALRLRRFMPFSVLYCGAHANRYIKYSLKHRLLPHHLNRHVPAYTCPHEKAIALVL